MNIMHFLISVALITSALIPQNVPTPKTPSEAYERATEPLRDWSKTKNPTLETNIKANEEQERRAREYLSLFRIEDWNGKQLFDLGQLYFTALLPEGTEKAFVAYLRDPAATEKTRAQRDLLWALRQQKKWDEAVPLAEQLLNDPKYDWDINTLIQFLIDGLRAVKLSKAIALSEKRLPQLLRLAESQGNNPRLAITLLGNAAELGGMYRESGNVVSAEEFSRHFLYRFQHSPLASNEKIKSSVEASILRINLLATHAPTLEGRVFVDMPQLNIADLKGKVVLLDFLAHWCVPCIMSFPTLDSIQKKYESKGLITIGVTQYYGFFGEHENMAEEEELAALKTLKLDGKAKFGFIVGPKSNFSAYGIMGLPAYALIDRTGKVRVIKIGGGVGEDFERIVQSLITEPLPSR